MPMHDWTRVTPGLFHDFHQAWSADIRRVLNTSVLPDGYSAFIEQRIGGPEPDLVAVEIERPIELSSVRPPSGVGVVDRPRTSRTEILETESVRLARKRNRISIRHQLGKVVAIVEIVSPGNKSSRDSLRSFVRKAARFLRAGVHFLVIDLFPPTPRDPAGLHAALWEELGGTAGSPPPDKPLTSVSYCAGSPLTAFIENFSVGDDLPTMPLFITPREHVLLPLQACYDATWSATPRALRERLNANVTPRE